MIQFQERTSVEQVEEGNELAPKFDANGVIPAVTTDFATGELLMHAYMNEEALRLTIETGEAHYWSRSRQCLWRKGATSGLIQHIRDLRIDDDQDCIWLRVEVAGGGASCHVGYRSCFYRSIPYGDAAGKPLEFQEDSKAFDPKAEWIKRQPFALELDRLVNQADVASKATPSNATDHHHQDHNGGHAHELDHDHHHGHQHEQGHDHSDEHDHTHDHHHLSHGFVAVAVELPDPIEGEHLHRWLTVLPRDILRVKGLVRLTDQPEHWFHFQRVEGLPGEAKLYKLPEKPAVPPCALLIGVKLDEKAIRDSLEATKKEVAPGKGKT